MMVVLQAKKRENKASRATLAKEGFIPAVFYGNKKETQAIAIPLVEFKKVWKESGESTTVTLDVEGEKVTTLIHDIQRDPSSHGPIHVDFLAIDTNKPVTVHVPIEFDGESPAVKAGLGSVVKVMHEIEIEALPKDLPHAIHADLALIAAEGDHITVAELPKLAGVTYKALDTDVVATLEKEHEEEPAESGPASLDDIKVEEKGKKEDEAEA